MDSIINNINDINNMNSKIKELYDKYKNHSYMSNKLTHHIMNVLPSVLENIENNYKEREARKTKLTEYRDVFTENFLQKTRLSYTPNNSLFLVYDGNHFIGYSEDDIQHKILSKITEEQSLISWKHKIKNNIIKRIKEVSPINVIPESSTIQFVINNIYPSIFKSRNHAKYFLCVIGDCILNKGTSKLIYLITSQLKDLVREITICSYTYFGIPNVFNCLKMKYYDHDYKSIRLLYTEDEKIKYPWNLSKYMVDLLCVATHYSKRYENSDKFLSECSEIKLASHIRYLINKEPTDIINEFTKDNLMECSGQNISTKNMIYLWKTFLKKQNLPQILFYDNLKSILKSKLEYDEEKDSYLNVTSVNLPLVSSFLNFWEVNMVEDILEPEIEIDELSKMYKIFNENKNTSFTDKILLELIGYFYPDVEIEEDKYILNMRCKLWDKRVDVINAIDIFKCKNIDSNIKNSLYSVYNEYSCNNSSKFIVSKKYFYKIAEEYLGNEEYDDMIII